MKLDDFTNVELQRLRILVGDPKQIALYFEDDYEYAVNYIENNTCQPVDYVKRLASYILNRLIIEYGYSRCARELGVSKSFLKKHIKDRVNS